MKVNYQIFIIFAITILDKLAIKQLFKFSFCPIYASELPREIKTHEIGVKINKKRQKIIHDITDTNLEKNNEILVVFGKSIPE